MMPARTPQALKPERIAASPAGPEGRNDLTQEPTGPPTASAEDAKQRHSKQESPQAAEDLQTVRDQGQQGQQLNQQLAEGEAPAGRPAAQLRVIGAGFGRTGTLSLWTALNRLGYKTHHMIEVGMGAGWCVQRVQVLWAGL